MHNQYQESSSAEHPLPTPLVSVVVTTMNRLQLLRETLDSILSQGVQNLELIVVDNASVDGTEEYFKSNPIHNLTYLRNPVHCSVIATNRNRGLRVARGQYVAFCDDDDIWAPGKLAKQIEIMQAHPDVSLCYTNALIYIAGSTAPARWLYKKKIYTRHFFPLLRGSVIPNSSVLVRRCTLEEVGYLNESPELLVVEDYELWLRIAHQHNLFYIDEPLLLYRVHPGNVSSKLGLNARRNIRVLLSIRKTLNLNILTAGWYVAIQYVRMIYYTLVRR